MNLDPPTNWGSDSIAKFIDLARSNMFATFDNFEEQFDRLVAVDGAYTRLIDNLDDTDAWFTNLFLLNAHACYLGGVQLGCSGQLPQSYMVLRGCLESSLYGFFFHNHPEKEQIWTSRHNSQENTKRVKAEFQITKMLKQFEQVDTTTGSIITQLYNMTIDLGAHPNVWGMFPHLDLPTDDSAGLGLKYITDDMSDIVIALENCARVGICCLSVFSHICQKKFADLGLPIDIDKLKSGL